MFPVTYGTLYKTPDGYQPPDETELINNLEYPNMNSRDYAKRALNRNLRMHSAWECIDLNDERNVVIATNKLSGREWNGSIWGFEKIDTLVPEQACYKLQCNSIISKLKFVGKNMLLIALRSGKVQLWSTHSEVRNAKNPYCLFLIGEKCEHSKPISAMDIMKADINKALTGSKDGTLKIWDMGCADLYSTHTFRFAHTDAITSVATSHKNGSIFTTSSLDKSALLWDDRLTRPAIAIYENHKVRFKSVTWASPEQDPDEYIVYLGDESGFAHTVDIRQPNAFVQSKQYFDKPIRKILPQSKMLAVIADNNVVKVSTTPEHEIVYENSEAQDFLRDCIWHDSKLLLTVGYEGKMNKHKIE